MIGSIITYFLLLNECADEKRSGYDRKKVCRKTTLD